LLKKIGKTLFHFFSSLKLAVSTLLSLAAILVAGTIVESYHDADAAHHYVYGTWWFATVLCFLGMNVLCAALSRWPWKRHHFGFVVTHLGIILILIGSLTTLLKGYEGQVVLAEGENTRRMTLKNATLFIFDPAKDKLEEFPADFRFAPPSAERPFVWTTQGGVRLSVTDYLPHAEGEIQVREGEGMDNPALKLRLQGSRATISEWIFSREWDRRRLSLGPASLTYLEVPDLSVFRRILRDPAARGPLLWLPGALVPVSAGQDFAAGAWRGRFQEYFPYAAVNEDGLKNAGSEPVNPALRLQLIRPSALETYVLFAHFPELPARDQEGPGAPVPMRLLWIPPELGSGANELVLARLANGSTAYALRAGGEWKEPALLDLSRELETGWMDFKLSVLENVRKGRISKIYRRVPVPAGREGPPSAIRLQLSSEQGAQEFWLGRGEEQSVALGPRRLRVAYGLKSRPLGFELALVDFHMGTYEGTSDPSSFQSQVTVVDPENLDRFDRLIQMNQPLKYRKYKIFQASYQLNPGGSDWSVLAVAYDPGIYVKYAGALIMVAGIILMFFFRPLFLRKKPMANAAEASTLPASRPLTPARSS
jgi:hypothetical protein